MSTMKKIQGQDTRAKSIRDVNEEMTDIKGEKKDSLYYETCSIKSKVSRKSD